MSNVASGKLRHRVTIESRETIINSCGEQVTEWVEFAKRWAAVEPLSAREFIAAQQVQSAVTTRITMRTLPGLLPSMRIIHGNAVYNIAGILPDKNSGGEYITIPCSAGVNDG